MCCLNTKICIIIPLQLSVVAKETVLGAGSSLASGVVSEDVFLTSVEH